MISPLAWRRDCQRTIARDTLRWAVCHRWNARLRTWAAWPTKPGA